VEELVREGAETVIGSSSISLDSVNFGFLVGHFVEQVSYASALDGQSKHATTKLHEIFALQGKMARGGMDRTCTRIR
jgi:hypothetical protein